MRIEQRYSRLAGQLCTRFDAKRAWSTAMSKDLLDVWVAVRIQPFAYCGLAAPLAAPPKAWRYVVAS